jgi:tetratricopeptide (TPR) repeat protein
MGLFDFLRNSNTQSSSARLFKIGSEDYLQKNYQEALDKFLMALGLLEKSKLNPIQKDELTASIFASMGQCRAKLRQFELAEIDLNKAIALRPDDQGLWFGLGSVKLDQNQFEEAISLFIKMIDIDPSSPDGYYFLGVCKMELKRYEEAILNYEEALAIEINSGSNEDIAHTLIGLGQSNYGLEKLANALMYYDRAISFDNNNSAAFVLRGNCKVDMGDKRGGCEDYHRALKLGDSMVQENIDEHCK